jgi:amidase
MELWQLTATEIIKKIKNKEISVRESVASAINRSEEVNPNINAVVASMGSAALERADSLDKKIKNGQDLGILGGVPVTVKVNVDQVGYATTNGLKIQKDLVATQNNPVISNLEKAGAIIIGRTNTPAFSLRWFTRNTLHGHTLNPINKNITPGGSSGGAAAAVAAGIGAIGHGTDIAGSIRYPAYACGVHGLRPSLGRVPAHNFSGSDRFIGGQLMAVSGPIARSIEDLKVSFNAMSRPNFYDPWYMSVPLKGQPRPKKAALCLSPDGMKVSEEVKAALISSAKLLEDSGWEVHEVDTPPLRKAMESQLMLWMAEMEHGAAEAVIKENDPDANIVYQRLKNLCPQVDLNGIMKVLQARASLIREWRLFLQTYTVMLCPVSGELPFDDLKDVTSEQNFEDIVEAQLTQIGLPFVSLPGLTVTTGTVSGRPVGIQIVSDAYREDLMLDVGNVIGSNIATVNPV